MHEKTFVYECSSLVQVNISLIKRGVYSSIQYVYFEAFSLIQVTALLLSMKYLMHNDLEVIWPKKRKIVYLMIYVQTSVWCE